MGKRNSAKLPAILAAGALFIILLTLVILFLIPEIPDKTAPLDMESVVIEDLPDRPASKDDTEAEAREEEAPALKQKIPARSSHQFLGRVLDRETLDPVTTFDVALQLKVKQGAWTFQRPVESFSDPGGNFDLTRIVAPGIDYRLSITAPGYAQGLSEIFSGLENRSSTYVQIMLDPAARLRGRVWDGFTRKPVEGALIYSAQDAGPEFGFDDDITTVAHGVSNAQGRFHLYVGEGKYHTLVARHPYYHESILGEVPPSDRPVLYLRAGFRIQGTALDASSLPMAGATLLITGARGRGLPPLEHRLEADWDGSFSSEVLHPGAYWIRLEETPDLPKAFNHFDADRILITDRNVTGIRLGSLPGRGSITGYLYSKNLPVAEMEVAALCLTPAPFMLTHSSLADPRNSLSYHGRWPGMNPDPPKAAQVKTDEEGRFAFHFLKPGEYKFYFFLPGGEAYSNDTFIIPVEPDSHREWSFHLSEGVIHGQLLDHKSGRPLEHGGGTCHLYDAGQQGTIPLRTVKVKGDGSFHIPFVPAGDYECLFHVKGYAMELGRFSFSGYGNKAVKVKLQPGSSVQAEVLCDAPIPPAHITFVVIQGNRMVPMPAGNLELDSCGRYVIHGLTPGKAELACFADPHHPFTPADMEWAEQKEVILKPGRSEVISFEFDPQVHVRGKVYNQLGHVENIRVCLAHRHHFWKPLFLEEEGVCSARTDNRGAFDLLVKEEGNYSVALYSDDDFRMPEQRKISNLNINRMLNYFLFQTGLLSYNGRLVDGETGNPIPRAEVYFRQDRTQCMTLSDDEGFFRIRNLTDSRALFNGVYGKGYLCPMDHWIKTSRAPVDPLPLISVGDQWSSLKLVLEGRRPPTFTALQQCALTVGHPRHTPLYLSQLLPLEEGAAFLVRGLDPGSRKLTLKYQADGFLYQGEAQVELKEGETRETRIVLK